MRTPEIVLTAIAILASGQAAAENAASVVVLACTYDIIGPVDPDPNVLPDTIQLDLAAAQISWGSITTQLVAIRDAEVAFNYGEFSYVLSRRTGQIRLRSDSGYIDWEDRKKQMMRSLIRRGAGAAQAAAYIEDNPQLMAFRHRTHIGQCAPATDRLF